MENTNMENPTASTQLPSQSILEELSGVLQNLSQRLQNLESRSPVLESAPLLFQPTASPSGAAPKVALPEKFGGTIRKYRDFIISVENIFCLQPLSYPTDEVKCRFIGTLLTGDALAWFRNIVEYETYRLKDYSNFKKDFKEMFDDPNSIRHACAQLDHLQQGKGSVSSYAIVFRRLASETGYNEAALRHNFIKGLSDDNKNALSKAQDEPERLEDLIRFCVKMDQRIYDRKKEIKFKPFNQSYKSSPVFAAGPSPMDLDAITTGTQRAKFKKLTAVEKQRRIDSGLCLYCASDKHKLPDCTVRKAPASLNVMECVAVSFGCSESQNSPRLKVKLSLDGSTGEANALVDSGATANFMSFDFFKTNGFGDIDEVGDLTVKMANGSVKKVLGTLSRVAVEVVGSSAETKEKFLLIDGLKYAVILGVPWLQSADPSINWKMMEISFKTQGESLNEMESSSNFYSTKLNDSDSGIPANIPKNLNKDDVGIPNDIPELCEVSLGECFNLMAQEFNERRRKLGESLNEKERSSNSDTKIITSSLDKVPAVYKEFISVFNVENLLDELPPRRSFDLEINLKDPAKDPPFIKIYNLSHKEEVELKNFITENLKKGFIRPSKSPYAAPIFFVPKKCGGLRPCIDYRLLNDNTVKDKFPLPLVSDVLSKFTGSTIFTQIDLKNGYNLVRIKEGHEHKAAFRCKFGQFEPLVVQFGLANAPAVFQRFVNSIFQDLLDISVVIYLDDILIFSNNLEEHIIHVKEVLDRMKTNNLVGKLSKCFFHVQELTFLGHVVSPSGITMEKEKQEAIEKFALPRNLKELRSFLGMCNYYRKFIRDYSRIAYPLTDMTKKDRDFIFSTEALAAFDHLKQELSENVILKHPQMSQKFYVFTDASNFAIGGVLAQKDGTELRPVEFYSRKLCPAEINYSVYDRELLSIVEALTEWRHFLIHSPEVIEINSDHNNLKFFRTNQLLKPRHARWAEFLSQFQFVIKHIKGADNVVADCLSRNPSFEGPSPLNQEALLNEELFEANALEESGEEEDGSERSDESDAESVPEAEDLDHDFPVDIGKYLNSENNAWECKVHSFKTYKNLIKNFTVMGDKIYYSDRSGWKRLYLPIGEQRIKAFRRFHDDIGHLAPDSILELVKRRYYWPKMEKDVRELAKSCPKCELARGRGPSQPVQKPPIRPIPPAAVPFERIGLDFMPELTRTKKGNRNIITCIDYATRWVIVEAVPDITTERVLAFLYSKVITQYGAPFEIITDRGSQFTSNAFDEFMNMYAIKHLLTSPYHPQTNGMVERMHQMVKHGITTMSEARPNRWDEFLDQTIFGIRTRTHATVKESPFFLLYGYHPRFPGDLEPIRQVSEPMDDQELRKARERYTADRLEELGQTRAAAYKRSLLQAQKMKERDTNNTGQDYYFEVGDLVKMKHFGQIKFEFQWKGPYMVRELGFPGTYWLIRPDGEMLDSTVNQIHLAPWLSETQDNISYFYDGRKRGEENTVDTQTLGDTQTEQGSYNDGFIMDSDQLISNQPPGLT